MLGILDLSSDIFLSENDVKNTFSIDNKNGN